MSQDSNTENNSKPRLSLKKKGDPLTPPSEKTPPPQVEPEQAMPEPPVPETPAEQPSRSGGDLTPDLEKPPEQQTPTAKLNLKKTGETTADVPVEGLELGEMDPFSPKSLSRAPFAPTPPTDNPSSKEGPAAAPSHLPPPLPTPPTPPTELLNESPKSAGHKKAFTLLAGLALLFLIGGGGIYLLYIGLAGAMQSEDPATPTAKTTAPAAPIPTKQARTQAPTSAENVSAPAPTPAPVTDGAPTPRVAQADAPTDQAPDRQVADWIESMKPQSVARNRMMVDGQRYDLGSLIHENLQIRWVAVDMDLGVLVFEDAKSVRYEKDF